MSLSWRILFLVLLITTFSGLANYALTQYQGESLRSDSEKILVETIFDSLRDTLVQDVIDGNKLRVTNVLKKLHNNDNPIEFLYVTNDGSNIFSHSFKNGFPRYLLIGNGDLLDRLRVNQIYKYKTDRGIIFEYAEALIPGYEAVLHIGINQSEIREKLAENRQEVFISSVMIALLALICSYFFVKMIAAPLVGFTDELNRFGEGKAVDFRRVATTAPEIKKLASTFQQVISDRQKALGELQEREENLSITLNSIGDAVITSDVEGKITRMNPIAEKLTGWSFEEAKGQAVTDVFSIINTSTREPAEHPAGKVLATGETVYLSNHTTLIARDKTEFQIADSAAPIRDGDDQVLGIVLVFNDVTEAYRLRERAAAVQQQLQGLLDDMQTMVVITEADGVVTFANNTPLKVSGIELDDVLGKSIWDCIWFDYDAEVQVISKQDCMDAWAGQHVSRDIQIPTPGGLIWLTYSIHPVLNEEGRVIQLLHEGRDISERKKIEYEMRRAQKMDALGKLTGGIAHDYNNMLGVVLGYSDLLKGLLLDQPELAKYVDEIRHAGERGAKLTQRLLSFARKDNGANTAESVDINSLLHSQQHMLEKTLTPRISLVFGLGEDLWRVKLDAGELEDSILNISINAMHAMEHSQYCQLSIFTRNESIAAIDAQALQLPPGDYVLLSITDTGCGMDEDTQEQVFDPFFSTKGTEGTGLGLSQVYGFVKQSKGTIKVYSETLRGTQFVLYFPRHQAKSLPQETEVIIDDPLPARQARILVVDDEPSLLALNEQILSQQGYDVITVGNARGALDVLGRETIDLLISDVIMPDMDGYQLLTIVHKEYPQVITQLVSGFTGEHPNNELTNSHLEDMLHKPYSAKTLLDRVAKLLDTGGG